MRVRVLGVLGFAVRLALGLLLAGRGGRGHPGLRPDQDRHPGLPVRQGPHPGLARAPSRSRLPAAGPVPRRCRDSGELLQRAVLSVAGTDAGRSPADRGLPPAPASAPGCLFRAWPYGTSPARPGHLAAGDAADETAIPGNPARAARSRLTRRALCGLKESATG